MKKFLMTLVWQIAQAGSLLSLFFFSTALAGIFWPIVGSNGNPPGPLYALLASLGIPPQHITVIGILLLFLASTAFMLVVGILYDRTFKLWREQMEIAVERNEYADNRLMHKEQLQFERFFLPLAKTVYELQPNPELGLAIVDAQDWVKTGRIL